MEQKSWRYEVTAWAVTIGLLLQLFPFWVGLNRSQPVLADSNTAVSSLESLQNQPVQPDALAQPLSISRVQSTYQAGGTAVITYTVSNNLPPTLFPDLSAATSVTETVAILAGIAPEDDLNALYDVNLSLTLLPAATYLDSSFPPSQTGGTFSWDLPVIPPGTAQTLTVTIGLPANSPGFTELDQGALVTATAWDTPLAVAARPAVLAPDSIDPAYLQATAAADLSDGDALWQAAAFTQDPLSAFYFVRDMGFEPYEGALRGTRGTLWSGAGNSIDQSSLLIAMLRAAGIPARYRHGSLDLAQAQTLIGSLFPAADGVAGNVPPGTATADPLNDPTLLALAQDHWWVEAYLPDLGWTDLDPTFADAEPGQLFATPATDGSDRLPLLPQAIHHTVSFALQVEQYTAFPLNGTFLTNSTPLTVTIPTAQLAGKQIAVSQFVTDENMGGAPFTARYITYEPYLTIKENDIAFIGDPFQDVLSNFPLSVLATTAVWLEYTITAPNGQSETFARAIKDLIGPAARLTGGDLDLAFGTDSAPFLTADEQYVHWTLPNTVPDWAYQRRLAGMLPTILDLGGQAGNLLEMGSTEFDDLTAAEQSDLMRAAGRFTLANTEVMALTGLRFAWLADAATARIGEGLHTRLFYSQPRLFAAGTAYDASEGELIATVDLRTTRVTNVVAPGQSLRAAHTAQWLKGVTESYLEGLVLEAIFEQTAVTTANVFQAMSEAGIEPVLFRPADLSRLEQYPYSEAGKARMSQALLAGRTVLAPAAMVELNGEPVLAWWEIDPITGETISVGENGLHIAAVNYKIVEMLVEEIVKQLLDFLIGLLLDFVSGGYIGSYDPVGLAQMLMPIGQGLNEIFTTLAEFFQSIFMAHTLAGESVGADWLFMPAHLCPVDNCGVEQFFLTGHMAPIPLPDMLFAYPEDMTALPLARSMMTVAANDPPGDPSFTLTANPDSSTVTPGLTTAFQAEIAANFDGEFEVYGYAPAGWDLTVDPAGNVTARPAAQTMPGEYAALLVARPQLHPELMATAVHTITVNPVHEAALSLSAEPNLTVPMGQPAYAAVSNQTNDAEAEIPQAAYTLLLENRSNSSRTYNLTVSGPPAGWVIMNGMRQAATAVTLVPGASDRIGLYIQPEPAAVPAPGLSFPIEVTAVAQDDPALTDTDTAVFTMPGQPFNYLTLDTAVIYAMPGTPVEFELTMENVGNAAGTFPLSAALPLPAWSLSGLPDDMTLAVGEAETAVLTLTASDVEVGRNYRLLLAGSAPDSYTQYLPLPVQIVSANSGPIFQQADHLAAACPLAEPQLSAALRVEGCR